MIKLLLSCLAFGLSVASSSPLENVSVSITSTGSNAGDVRLAVFATAADFEADEPIFALVSPYEKGTTMALRIPEAGKYVIAAFHDLNGNGELDRNFFGVPTEPYGFSRPPASKWEKPAFADIAADLRGGEALTLGLRLWREY